MKSWVKRLAAKLPPVWQQELKRHYLRSRIKSGQYGADEPETALLRELVRPGDWVLDVGANVGHYTLQLSALVGRTGRVIAFEPVPESFELLASAAALAPAGNITLINAAASDGARVLGMRIPLWQTGLKNYYRAQLDETQGDVSVQCLPIDALPLPQRIRVAKIDAEGHELSVLKGMRSLLLRDWPVLVIEDTSDAVLDWLTELGYTSEKHLASANRVYRPGPDLAR